MKKAKTPAAMNDVAGVFFISEINTGTSFV